MRHDQTNGPTTGYSAFPGYPRRTTTTRKGVGQPQRLDRPHADGTRTRSAWRTVAYADRQGVIVIGTCSHLWTAGSVVACAAFCADARADAAGAVARTTSVGLTNPLPTMGFTA